MDKQEHRYYFSKIGLEVYRPTIFANIIEMECKYELSDSEVRMGKILQKLRKNTIIKNRIIVYSILFVCFITSVLLASLFAYIFKLNNINNYGIGVCLGLSMILLHMTLTEKFPCNKSKLYIVKHKGKYY